MTYFICRFAFRKMQENSPSLFHIQRLSDASPLQVLFSTKHNDSPQFIPARGPIERRAGKVTSGALFEWCNIFRKNTTDTQIKRIERLFDRFIDLLVCYLNIRRTERDTAKILNDKKGKVLALTGVKFFKDDTKIRRCSGRRTRGEFWQR